MKRFALALIAVVLLAGCGDDHDKTPESRVPGPTDTLVVFERVGGIAGVRQRLDVRPDGAARLTSGVSAPEVKRFQLSPGELDGLRAAREHVDFDGLKRHYGPELPVADGVAVTLTVDGRQVTVLTEGDPPPELERLIRVCVGIVEVHARR
jgi:hypothetical protein